MVLYDTNVIFVLLSHHYISTDQETVELKTLLGLE